MVKKEIISISPFLPPNIGGVESLVLRLNSLTSRKLYHVHQIGYYPLNTNVNFLKKEQKGSYTYYRLRWFGKGLFNKIESKSFLLTFVYLFPGLLTYTIITILKEIKFKNIKTLHAYGFISAAIVIIINLFGKKKTILTTHSFYNFKKRSFLSKIIRVIVRKFDLIIPNTKESYDEMIFLGVKKKNLALFQNWCDLSIYKKIQPKNNPFLKKKKFDFNVVFLGRLIPLKGIDIVLNLSLKFQNVGFFVIGNGEYKETLLKKRQNNLQYFFNITEKEISYILNLCDLSLSPVRYDESHSNSLMESVSCGLPILIPKRGAIGKIYNQDVALFCKKKLSDIDFIFSKAIKNKGKLKQMSRECITFAKKNFSEKNAQLFLNNY